MTTEIGTLVVVVLKARNLRDIHSFYKQDVYAQISLNGKKHDTRVEVKGGQHPVWDDEIRVPVMKGESEKERKLQVSCWAKESRTDELLASGSVDISETLKTGEFDGKLSLHLSLHSILLMESF
jgi:Ca2+-dependent lipid-binding protein